MAASDYPKPSVTVDVVILTLRGEELQVLLVKRDVAPYKGRWAIPGGFVHIDESLEAAARRELREETGVTDVYLEQALHLWRSGARSARARDQRGLHRVGAGAIGRGSGQRRA